MFNKSLGEILGILGLVLSVGLLIFGGAWVLMKGLGVDMTDIFNNIQLPS